MKLVITEGARQDLFDAYHWYESQKEGLGDQFFAEFRAGCNDILKNPKGYQLIRNFRQIPLKRFPFLTIYDLVENTVVVFAVFHTSKHPKKKPQR